jgi:hypothetical protein
MKNMQGASAAAELVAQTLTLVQAPAAPAADAPAAEAPAAEAPAADAPPAAEAAAAPVWPPPPSPPPKPFDATAVAARFTGQAPAPAVEAPAAPASDPGIPEAPPATPGRAPTQAELFTWAKLRTEATAFHKQAAEAMSAAEAAKAEAKRLAEEKAQVAAEKLEADRKVTELTEKIGKLSLAESPEFKSKYDLKRAELSNELSAALVKFAKIPPDQANGESARILSADPASLADMVADLNPAVGGMIMAIANKVGGIDAAREQELANWRESSAAHGYEEARRSVVETAETRSVFADKALALAKSYGNPVFTATDPEAKAQADALEQAFRGFVQTATEEQLVAAAAEGFSSAQLYDAFNALAAENEQLRNQIAGRTRAALPPMFAAQPYVRTDAPPPAPPANVTPVTKRVTPEDMVRESLSRSLSAVGGPPVR